jgi:3-isopropylmalate/(R)-2-methylmalate dehydratase large subunit
MSGIIRVTGNNGHVNITAHKITIDKTPIKGKALIYWDPQQIEVKRGYIDTDQIIPSEFCVSGDMNDLWKPWGEHVFAHMDPDFRQKIGTGQTFIIAGENFGIGSSREMAPAGLLRAAKDMGKEGNLVIIAKSFGAIFRKNSFNLGLHILECPEAVDDAKENDEFELDPISRKLMNLTQNKSYTPKPFTSQEEKIRLGGGLVGAAKAVLRRARKINSTPKNIATRFPDGSIAERMSLAQQILYAHKVDRKETVEPGQTINAFADLLPASDGTAPFAISVFLNITDNYWRLRPWKSAIVNDHFVPFANDEERAQYELGRSFACRFNLTYPQYSQIGDGIFHFYFPYSGLVLPGMLIVGADSHTTTYGAYGAFGTGVGSTELGAGWAVKYVPITFSHNRRVVFNGDLPAWVTGKDIILKLISGWGKGVAGASIDMLDPEGKLPITYRHTIANMAVEGNALSAIFPQDEITDRFFAGLGITEFPFPRLQPGKNADYQTDEEVNLSTLISLVAKPFHPSNSVSAAELAVQKIKIAQAYLGSCTNGSYADMLQAALVINASGQSHLADGVRLLVFPGSRSVLEKMSQPETLLGSKSIKEIIESIGGEIKMPSCGHCFKPTADSPNPGQAIISTTNRNWANRQGKGVLTYLSNPYIAAASALLGYIGTPEELGIRWDENFRVG